MNYTLLINFLVIFFSALLYQPIFVFGDTIHIDSEGNTIDKEKYELIASEREKILGIKLRTGYNVKHNDWKDPIKLRKIRIEQWKNMRAMYNPDSLPSTIEHKAVTR
jgi:hypothetical protein